VTLLNTIQKTCF